MLVFAIVLISCPLTQREYFKQGKIDQFRQILEEGSSPGTFHKFIIPLPSVISGIDAE